MSKTDAPLPLRYRLVSIAALLAALAALGLSVLDRSGSKDDRATTIDRAEFEARVRSYMLTNPEIIPEAVRVLQQREQAAEQARMEGAVADHWASISRDPFSPVVGDPDAGLTVVEYYDYQCPYCRQSYPDVARLLEEHGDRIRYVFKQFPILDGPGDTDGISHTAARAAVAADRQGHFREFHHALMTARGRLTSERLFAIAEDVGLDVEQLRGDMADPEIDRYFEQTLLLAHTVGISGTPTYVIEGRVVTGAHGYDAIASLLEDRGEAVGGE